MNTEDPLFFHVDLDAFFAAVEQLDNPAYRGKPVIVGGEVAKRGVVSTCSYEARAFGVHSAMPMVKAVALCPNAIFVRGRMRRYQEKSQQVMDVLSSFSPNIQQISVDEAFLDMSGTFRLFGPVEISAHALQQAVLETTGLSISVGAACNRYIAKIASGLQKPNGLTIVKKGEEQAFISKLPLSKLWGVGEKTRAKLENAGLKTISEITNCSQRLLETIVGSSSSSFIYAAVRGIDPGICSSETQNRSISSERTFCEDIYDTECIKTTLLELCSDVFFRLLKENLFSCTIHIKIRYHDFRTVSIQETFNKSITDSSDLFIKSTQLFDKKYEKGALVRLVGVSLTNINEKKTCEQIDLFDTNKSEKKRKVEEVLLALHKKKGKKLVQQARLLKAEDKE